MELILHNIFNLKNEEPAREIYLNVFHYKINGTIEEKPIPCRLKESFDVVDQEHLKVLLDPRPLYGTKLDRRGYDILVDDHRDDFLKTKLNIEVKSVRKKLELIISIEEGKPERTTYWYDVNKVKVIICYSSDRKPSQNVRIGDKNQ